MPFLNAPPKFWTDSELREAKRALDRLKEKKLALGVPWSDFDNCACLSAVIAAHRANKDKLSTQSLRQLGQLGWGRIRVWDYNDSIYGTPEERFQRVYSDITNELSRRCLA